MKVLHVSASLSPEWGGPPKVVTGLTEALTRKGLKVSIFAPSEDDKSVCISNIKDIDVKLFSKGLLSKFWTSYSSCLAKTLVKEISEFDLVHIHEIWHYPQYIAYKAARSANKPFVVTIHGALEPWCLNHRWLKKKIYSILIQRKILKEASALHAITEEEVKNIYSFVGSKKVFLIPNGLNIDEFEKLPNRDSFEAVYPCIKRKKVILFLGRIHPKKGLDILARSFGAVLKSRNDVQLMIAGPDNDGYKSRLIEILKAENAISNTTFTGMLTGNEKLSALSRADIFVFPSYSEVLGISTLEAMACGLPVVITKHCNFPDVEKIGAGKVIDADVAQLSDALIDLLDNPELCEEMSNRGKRLVAEKYTWDKVADKMINAYEEILGIRKADREAK